MFFKNSGLSNLQANKLESQADALITRNHEFKVSSRFTKTKALLVAEKTNESNK